MKDVLNLLQLVQEELKEDNIKFSMGDFFNASKTVGMCTVFLNDGFVVEVRRREQTYDEKITNI